MENILIIKHGALGDVVLAIGTMLLLRERHPEARFTLMTMRPFVSLVEQTGIFADYVIDNRKAMLNLPETWRVLRALRDGRFDVIYDLQGRDRTRTYRCLLRWLAHRGHYDWHDYHHHCCYHTEKETVFLPAREEQQEEVLPFATTDLRFMSGKGEYFHLLPENFVMLIPGCSPQHPYKRWPVERYRELVQRLAQRSVSAVVIGTRAEEEEVKAICAGQPTAVNMVGKTSLLDVPQIALRARAVVGNDTGPSHMASLTGAFTIALYDHRTRLSVLTGPNSRCLVSEAEITRIGVEDVWRELEPAL